VSEGLPYLDRREAGRHLAKAVAALVLERPVVLGIPRGGVPVAAEIAKALGGELGVIVARKLGAPGQPELAVGAVTADGPVYIDEDVARKTRASPEFLAREEGRERREARRRELLFGAHGVALKGRDVVVVDDGIATGATAVAALRAVRSAGASRVVLAVPVGPRGTIAVMRREADAVVCPHVEDDFFAVGQFYVNFAAPADEDVKRLLAREQPAS
jgi:predicted phosphoribosyltransferase